MTEVSSAGFPHSDICGSRDICSSPQLFAAYHVFLRLLVPRHPPCALISLTFLVSLDFISVWNLLLWVLSLLRFVICYYDCFSFRCLVIISDIFKINFCIRFSRYDFDCFYQSFKRFAPTTHSRFHRSFLSRFKYFSLRLRISESKLSYALPREKRLNGDGEIRTLDPLLARQVLSQLSYAPMLVKVSSLACLFFSFISLFN